MIIGQLGWEQNNLIRAPKHLSVMLFFSNLNIYKYSSLNFARTKVYIYRLCFLMKMIISKFIYKNDFRIKEIGLCVLPMCQANGWHR